ncbi:hypothetical protein A4U64_27155 (plasmid) [Rhodococcus sp. WB1]|nr:hypothetical protein A4U64_27155 [Rhodococcus sp. WB1]
MIIHVCESSSKIDFFQNYFLHVDRGASSPDRHVDHHSSRADRVQYGVEYYIDAGTFETNIYTDPSGEFADSVTDRAVGRVQHMISYLSGLGQSCGTYFADNRCHTGSPENGGEQKPDRARTSYQSGRSRLRSTAFHCVVRDRQRFDESCLVEWYIAHWMYPTRVDHDAFAQSSTATGQSDHTDACAQMVFSCPARYAFIAHDIGFDHDVVADLQSVHTLAEFGNCSREFVAQRDGRYFGGQWVGIVGRRYEYGALEVFVNVCAANSAPGDVHGYSPRAHGWRGNVVYSYVMLCMKASGSHNFLLAGSYGVSIQKSARGGSRGLPTKL